MTEARDVVSLKEFLEMRFNNLERRITEMCGTLEKLSSDTVRRDRFESAVHKIEALTSDQAQLDNRIQRLEGKAAIGTYIVSLLVGLAGLLVGAWLKKELGI